MMYTLYLVVIVSFIVHSGREVEGVYTVSANPGTVTLNENDDLAQNLSTISCNGACNCYATIGEVSGLISFNTAANTVSKSACSNTSCGSCSSCSSCLTSSGCLTAPATYTVSISCTDSNASSTDSTSVTITVEPETPTLTIRLPASVHADNSMASGTVIATASTSSGPEIVQYVKASSVASSYSLGTANLFDLDTANGNIKVNSNPSAEYANTYSMNVCVQSRRQESCKTITINFDGCFERPNCNSQTKNTFSDQHGIGDTLFTVTYANNPSPHFDSISSTWQNLHFVIYSSTLSVAKIDNTTGVITTTGNVTVWPDYPHSSHTIVVTVTNPGYSCSYSSTCTMSMQFSFTNWPISLESLPASKPLHEDTDAQTLVHSIVTYDYNNPLHDNVTCYETYNENSSLLYLYLDGNYSYNAYSIYKLECQALGCGFICTQNGCMNYDLDNEFVITIRCYDAYGSYAEANFTLQITENQAPEWTNLPTTKTLNSDRISHLDILFSIYYTDAENETLHYNYTITPDQPDPPLFGYDRIGNYHNSPANITALVYLWDQVNSSYVLDFCGTERRNMVCSSLTIEVQEYCGPPPTCNDGSITVTDQFVVGCELLAIDLVGAPTGTSYTDLTYVIISSTSGLFHVDPTTGSITTLASLSVYNPPASQTHVLIANVYDTAACEVGACSLSITVNFTNFDIHITNMDNVSIDLHEDITTEVTLYTIVTADSSEEDDVSCYIDNANSVPTDTDIFSVEETDIGSNVFQIISGEEPGFDYAVHSSYTIAVICEDNYGSSDTASMTVNILENQIPTIDNLHTGDLIAVDPMTYFSGATLFTLETSDDEGDSLEYSCTVANSFVPLHCLTDGVVSLRRNVLVPEEDGAIYNITLCIDELMHNHTVCETLGVNFTSSKTNPELDNLPASVEVSENATIGTLVFNVTVNDPDLDEVHIFSMSAYPTGTLFHFDRNDGVLTLKSALDYETENIYSFVFSVRDTYLPGLEDKILTVNVTDVNEAPTLQLYPTTFYTHEENATFEIVTIPYTCTDPDIGQNMSLSITAGSYASYFTLNSSGILSFALDWNFEAEGLPLTTTLEVTCDDGNGLNDFTNIVVNIERKNEFVPVLNTYAENITIYSNQTLLDSLLTITATDDDYGHNGIFDFQIVGDGQGVHYFTIRSSGNSADLFIKTYIEWFYNYTFVLNIEVSDAESDALTSSVFVTVIYIAPELPIPTQEPRRCLLCTNVGVALVSTLCVEAFLVLVLICHVSKRMKIWQLFKLKPKPRKSENQSNTRRRRNTNDQIDESYRPSSEFLNRALPKDQPPSMVFYQAPKTSLHSEPLPVPKYEPPKSAISLAKLPDPTNPRADNSIRHNVVNPTNVTFFHPIDDFNVRSKVALAPNLPKSRRRHIPSLFQDTNNAPPGVVDPARLCYIPKQLPDDSVHSKETNNYNNTVYDVIPMFGRPDDRVLYCDDTHPPNARQSENALDF